DDLQNSSMQFKRGASKVRKQMWWKDMKMKLILLAVVAAILIIVIGMFLLPFGRVAHQAKTPYSPFPLSPPPPTQSRWSRRRINSGVVDFLPCVSVSSLFFVYSRPGSSSLFGWTEKGVTCICLDVGNHGRLCSLLMPFWLPSP
ncbi:hypothetical protein BDK51DRAFT_19634, partial [Blyttiomyces helicus]